GFLIRLRRQPTRDFLSSCSPNVSAAAAHIELPCARAARRAEPFRFRIAGEANTMSISLVGVTLHVADVERSLSFYQRLPESSILFHMPGTFALLRVGSGRLGLLSDQKRKFHVEIDCQDLDATCALLKEAGFEAEGPTTRAWGERDALVIDPDGNLVEFGQAHGPKT